MTPKEIKQYEEDRAACELIRPIRFDICERMGTHIIEWRSSRRYRSLVRTREAVAYIAREKFGLRFELVAIVCGWSDNSTAVDALKRIKADPDRVAEFESLYKIYKGAA